MRRHHYPGNIRSVCLGSSQVLLQPRDLKCDIPTPHQVMFKYLRSKQECFTQRHVPGGRCVREDTQRVLTVVCSDVNIHSIDVFFRNKIHVPDSATADTIARHSSRVSFVTRTCHNT
eukprot:m.314398 g.314398  ORF g.314398 m.314398 type:complete len:117 (+) comp20266_c0_seq6:1238-1588(+)